MSRFNPQKFNINDINGGERFENGQTPQQDAFNAPIEGSAYAIEQAEKAEAKADQALNFAFGSVGTFSPLTAYPIGSIYMSVNETSPALLFGGSWEKIKDKFLVGAGNLYALGATGGSADAVVVRHQHAMEVMFAGSGGNAWDGNTLQRGYEGEYHYDAPNSTANSLTKFTGEDGTGKNMPPYLSVYMWKRIA